MRVRMMVQRLFFLFGLTGAETLQSASNAWANAHSKVQAKVASELRAQIHAKTGTTKAKSKTKSTSKTREYASETAHLHLHAPKGGSHGASFEFAREFLESFSAKLEERKAAFEGNSDLEAKESQFKTAIDGTDTAEADALFRNLQEIHLKKLATTKDLFKKLETVTNSFTTLLAGHFKTPPLSKEMDPLNNSTVVNQGNNGLLCGRDVTCGENSVCTQTMKGAQCICEQGYVGDGEICESLDTVASGESPPIVNFGTAGAGERIADISLTRVGNDKLAMVYRNMDRRNRGYLVLGSYGNTGNVAWGTPEMFSWDLPPAANATSKLVGKTESWSPHVSGTPDGKILIVFRTKEKFGSCRIAKAQIDSLKARNYVDFSPVLGFCDGTAHSPMVGLTIADRNRFAVFYSTNMPGTTTRYVGVAKLFDITGHVMPMGDGFFEFAGHKVEALKVIPSTPPTSFFLSYKGPQKVDEMGKTIVQESVLGFGEFAEDALSFLPTTLSMEPSAEMQISTMDIGSSGSGPTPGSFLAFSAYYSAVRKASTLKLIELDKMAEEPQKKFKVLNQDTSLNPISLAEVASTTSGSNGNSVLNTGFTPFISAIIMGDEPNVGPTGKVTSTTVPRTVGFFYEPEDSGKMTLLHICEIDESNTAEIQLVDCRDKVLRESGGIRELKSVSLGFGRVAVLSTNMHHQPSFKLFSLF